MKTVFHDNSRQSSRFSDLDLVQGSDLPKSSGMRLLTIHVFVLASATLSLGAEIRFFPRVSSGQGPTFLEVINPTSTSDVFWLQIKGPRHFEEVSFEVGERSTLIHNEADLSPLGLEYSIKTKNPKLSFNRIQLTTGKREHLMEALPDIGTKQVFLVDPGVNLKVALLNLHWQKQKIKVSWLDKMDRTLMSETKESSDYNQSQVWDFRPLSKARKLLLEGEGRLQGRALIRSAWRVGKLESPQKNKLSGYSAYFVVGNSEKTQAYIAGIDDPTLIQKARKSITDGSPLIVFARIRGQTLGWNRNFFSKNLPPYSWETEEVTNIAEIGSIACDGNPNLVEEQIPYWLIAERICFWNYRVLEELVD